MSLTISGSLPDFLKASATTRGSKKARQASATTHGLMKYRVGARSAAGSMSALSPGLNVRGHRFQMHHYRGCAGDPLMGWRCEPLSFAYFSLRQAKKSRCAAPHRGDANKPIRNQGKANTGGKQPKTTAKGKNQT
ncbi:hypothetical protein [Paraburkholderia sp. BL23I1N1]|uniref:hypothetical protein n=1 Tax=Paraburkholderia sp. BL23I1N1 TaxID=1938802 RepID=UPI0011C3F08C|nr:hypothetical protein [Paraburkholderia sp. BL23I1N1]